VREVVHREPVWRKRSDFVIAASVDGNEEIGTEQLYARQLGELRFEICCIPFFVSDVALGDIVQTDATYLVNGVVEKSGRYVFRVWFGESSSPHAHIVETLMSLGALLEWSSENLVAADAADEASAMRIADYLHSEEQANRLVYETGRTR
jgi:hypothetical protein